MGLRDYRQRRRDEQRSSQPRRDHAALVWTSEELFVSGQTYFASLFLAIQHAQRSVWLEAYILKDDAVGNKVIQLLEEAAARGVDVRLHIDGFGSQEWINQALGRGARPKFPLRIFNPVNTWRVLRNLGTLNFRSFMRELRRLNRRTHRKLALIDGVVAYVGSMNLCSEPVETVQGQHAWRETAVRVQGPGVALIAESYVRLWEGKLFPAPRDVWTWSGLIRDNTSARQRWHNHRQLLRDIAAAKQRILITSAYFVPVRTLRRKLRRAARRGVDVRILVPGCSDVFFLPWVSRQFFGRMLEAGVGVFEYQHRMIHAKTILIDDGAWIGSSNLNGRSLYWDMEMDVRILKPETVAALQSQFENDLESSQPYTPQTLGPWLGIPRLIGYILLRISRHI